MKIAIACMTGSLDGRLDPRFGRCAFFAIYDTENQGVEFIPNPNKDIQEGAGPASVQLLAARQVTRIISGEFGLKIKSLLDSLKIQMVVIRDPMTTVREIINSINQE